MTSFVRNFNAVVFYTLFTAVAIKAQNIGQAIVAYTEKYTPERVYIHYDKSAYSAGETIWFKAYMMSEIAPADLSRTLYVDWIDDKGSLLQHSVSPVLEAVTNGQFDIPAEFRGKYIQVRAYTKWMLNFDSAFLYTKTFRILSRETTSSPSSPVAIIPSINFFPEGGDAIAGISNKIAFKANDQWGRPVKIKGVVINNAGKSIDSIRVLHDGMGYVIITPEPGASYSVKWKDEKNVEHITALPAVKQSGIALQVSAGTNRYFNVRYTKDVADAMDTLHIVGTMYQHEAFRLAKPTNAPAIRAAIPIANLPSGILTITVFDKRWNALAERITYINNEEYKFQPEFEVQRWGLNKRARNEIKITIPDSLVADLSIAVTDAAIGTDSSSNIISHLLLSSELKGEVYNPAYYFSNNADPISEHLDLVMLTNGWRRFKWEQVITGKFAKPKFQRDTAYLSLSGKVYGVLPGQIVPGTNIIMIVRQKDKQGSFIMEPLNPDGSFTNPAILFDTAHIYYNFPKATALADASVQFMPDRLPAPTFFPAVKNFGQRPDTAGFYRHWLLVNETNELANKLKIITLENVTVKSRTKSPVQILDEKYTSGMFIGDGYQFDLVNDPFAAGSMNIFNYLQGKVAGLQVNATSNPPTLQWRGGSPQLYLDEVPADANFISSVSVNDVAFIKVFRPPFMGGFNGANGAIAIYTRRGNDVKPVPGKGLANNKVFGYTQIKEFYSPNYSSFNKRNEERDLRTTLYWNPSVIVSPQKRQAVLIFYNNDVSQAFRVVIEGMTRDGRLTHIEQIME